MFILPAFLYLKVLPLFGNACIILLYPINPVLHMLVGQLSPSTGLAPFLGRPGQCGYFGTTPAGECVSTTYDYVCTLRTTGPIHSESSGEAGFVSGTFRLRSRDLTARSPLSSRFCGRNRKALPPLFETIYHACSDRIQQKGKTLNRMIRIHKLANQGE
ncbi:hypothetical protein AVEN_58526-1 [Araneus ventricosus]|uniref:Uncharacterized protein n=1 Tax=Araneus ventricosus TaxID=182803 RepID=A0A4Y2URQ6_ARAVE|nr:hypothetical protein AVEN_58526-1 [Araneus ventricosus]